MAYSFEGACALPEHLGIDNVNVNYSEKRINQIMADSEYSELFRSAAEKYQADDSMEIDAIVAELNEIAECFKENQYTIHFQFFGAFFLNIKTNLDLYTDMLILIVKMRTFRDIAFIADSA